MHARRKFPAVTRELKMFSSSNGLGRIIFIDQIRVRLPLRILWSLSHKATATHARYSLMAKRLSTKQGTRFDPDVSHKKLSCSSTVEQRPDTSKDAGREVVLAMKSKPLHSNPAGTTK